MAVFHPCVTAYLPYDPAKPFWLTNDYGETSAVSVPDLHDWFPPAEFRSPGMSTSRWGHELWLVHPTGERFPLVQHATQGDVSFTAAGDAWFNSYYWFDTTTQARPNFDWRIEDATAGEFSPWASTDRTANSDYSSFDDYLKSQWHALPTPRELQGTVGEDGIVELRWPLLPEASPDGLYVIELSINGGPWDPRWNVLPVDASEGMLSFRDTYTDRTLGNTCAYRVRFEFGGRQSAPSNIVTVPPTRMKGARRIATPTATAPPITAILTPTTMASRMESIRTATTTESTTARISFQTTRGARRMCPL
jgi:hypothetical protein